MQDRAVLFIDGNNWFHHLEAGGIEDRRQLDYAKISRKLVGPRLWLGTRYYIGRVDQSFSPRFYADQRRFLAVLTATDPKSPLTSDVSIMAVALRNARAWAGVSS